ncbi:MAG: hypothetical protein LC744_04950 [Chloroflexi bacterium]|nr:hypothetical protein [Chloroflexota bacterium]
MTRKSITTSRAVVACDVCGRTLLRGEHADEFIANGSRRMVCELCTARATNEGWIREGADNTLQVRRNGVRGSGRSLLERLRPRREPQRDAPVAPVRRVSGNVDRLPSRARPDDAPADEQDAAVERVRETPPPQAQEPPPASREPRHVRGVPIVSVMPSETAGAMVSIVVGWELCWYRYEVDLADEAAGVSVIDQGAELSELTDAEQVPNAAADERGLLILAT